MGFFAQLVQCCSDLGAQQGTSFLFSFTTQNAHPQTMICAYFALVAAAEEGGQSILHHQRFVIRNITYTLCSSFLLHSDWTTKQRPHTPHFGAAVGTDCVRVALLCCDPAVPLHGHLPFWSPVAVLFRYFIWSKGVRCCCNVWLTDEISAETIKIWSIRFCIWKTVREFKMVKVLTKISFLHPL